MLEAIETTIQREMNASRNLEIRSIDSNQAAKACAEVAKFHATRFAHLCRLRGAITNKDTVELWDNEYSQALSTHPTKQLYEAVPVEKNPDLYRQFSDKYLEFLCWCIDHNNTDRSDEEWTLLRATEFYKRGLHNFFQTQHTQVPEGEVEKLKSILEEAKLQIEYLHQKFQATGTGNAVLAQIEQALYTTNKQG